MTNNTQYAYVVTSDRGIEEIFTSPKELDSERLIQLTFNLSEADYYYDVEVVHNPDLDDETITLTLFWEYGRTATETIRRYVPINIT
jgi:hypothetical protein